MRRGPERRALVVAALLSGLVACLGPTKEARAQAPHPPRRTAVWRFEFDGKVSEVVKEQLSLYLIEGLAAAQFEVVAAQKPVSDLLKARPDLATCAKPDCFKEIASRLGADYLVVGRVDVKQKNYEIGLELINGRTGERIDDNKPQRCELCGIREAGELVGSAASGLASGLAKAETPGKFTFESSPPGALVIVDGRPLGFTPLTAEVPIGRHELEIRESGYESHRRTIESEPGKSDTVRVDLAASLAGGSALPPSTAAKVVGWIGVVAGLAAIAGGAYTLFALDGEKVTCPPTATPGAECRRNAELPTLALLAGGGIALGVGGTSLYFAYLRGGPGAAPSGPEPSDAPAASAGPVSGFILFSRGTF